MLSEVIGQVVVHKKSNRAPVAADRFVPAGKNPDGARFLLQNCQNRAGGACTLPTTECAPVGAPFGRLLGTIVALRGRTINRARPNASNRPGRADAGDVLGLESS